MLALLVGIGTPVAAQRYKGYPGTHLTVDVRVASIMHGADSVRITYVLSSRPFSEEQLFHFIVEAEVPGRDLSLPPPKKSWASSTRIGERSVVWWSVRDDSVMTPGKVSAPLAFTANGLPGIVNARVEGWGEPEDSDGWADDDPRFTSRAEEVTSVPLKVVGVVASPRSPTPAVLIARLRALVRQTCTLEWTTSVKTCGALDAHLRMPSPKILDFLSTLELARGQQGGVNDNAYWLLRSNAEIVRELVEHTTPVR